MMAQRPLPGRRSPRAVHPVVAVLFAFLGAMLLATAYTSVVRADPPPPDCPTFGGCIVVSPDSGPASASFKVHYWVIPDGACSYDLAYFYWDGGQIGSAATIDPVDCDASISLSDAPTPKTGSHIVSAIGCEISPTDPADITCYDFTSAETTYTVVPVPVIKVTPTRALAADGFKVSYRTGDTDCIWTEAQVFWDGKAVGPRIPLDSGTCRAVATFDKTPTGGVGRHNVSVQACNTRSCSSSTEARTRFTVLPKPTPTPTATPTPKPTAEADAHPIADSESDADSERDARGDSESDARAEPLADRRSVSRDEPAGAVADPARGGGRPVAVAERQPVRARPRRASSVGRARSTRPSSARTSC